MYMHTSKRESPGSLLKLHWPFTGSRELVEELCILNYLSSKHRAPLSNLKLLAHCLTREMKIRERINNSILLSDIAHLECMLIKKTKFKPVK